MWIQTQLKQLRRKAVLYIFNRYFAKLVYSFARTDEIIEKMSQVQRDNYHAAIDNWINSEAYTLEYEGEMNELYEELAAKAQTEDVMTAYRLVMLKVKNKDLRLRQKMEEASKKRAFQSMQNNLRK